MANHFFGGVESTWGSTTFDVCDVVLKEVQELI